MNITKVKVKGARIHITWITPCEGSGEPDEHELRSNERPAQPFIDAMLGLRQAIVEEAELPEEMTEQITPVGLSIKHYDDGRMGAVISGTRKLTNSNSPLVLNTPHKPSEGANETDQTPLLGEDTTAAVDKVIHEAVKYIQGERAPKDQQSLPFEEKASPKDEIPTVEIDLAANCSECGKPGATPSGLCLACLAKRVEAPSEEPVGAAAAWKADTLISRTGALR